MPVTGARPATAMILAAGRGERMRPLTDRIPKPLVEAGGVPLIVHQIRALERAGIRDLVVNLAHLGEQIRARLGQGEALGVRIRYSEEPPGALDTGGGIRHALHLLGTAPFLVVNADVWTDLNLATLELSAGDLAQLVVVPNPRHHPAGDFRLQGGRLATSGPGQAVTFAGIGVYRPELFADLAEGSFPLAPVLRGAMARGRVGGALHRGRWYDVGTVQRLQALERHLRQVE